jgi:methyl-accepting chemotaxis protein
MMLVAAVVMAGMAMRRGVCDSYIATVVRMEGLAAGDLDTPIRFTEYRDCVGRMTKAMFTFRDTAVANQAHAKAQTAMVKVLGDQLARLRAGDMTARIDVDLPAEYAVLGSNFNDAVAAIRDLIGSVSESATTIRTGSGEIAQASEDLARRTESNAASLEETAASVTQMDGRLRASASAATRTVERADQAIATVGGGRAVADEAVQAMGRVSDSAKGIDSVIEGLDKIAFQTRVLAMNAAVEAGRAGDAGRGFAVVADLVSALAMRAEEEAKRARDQLTVTQSDIVTAVEAVTKVDGALSNISGDVAQVHELLASMAADNQAQSAAITQISAAIGTMDQSTQQNAAMVEETSAAARNLASEVGNLADQAGRFKVGRTGAARDRSTSLDRRDYHMPAAYA